MIHWKKYKTCALHDRLLEVQKRFAEVAILIERDQVDAFERMIEVVKKREQERSDRE